MSKRVIWFDARNLKEEDIVLPKVLNLHYEYILVRNDNFGKIYLTDRIKRIVEIDNEEAIELIPNNVIILSTKVNLLNKAKTSGYKTALYTKISNHDEMDSAWQQGLNYDFLIVELLDETDIPLELLIARLQDKETILLKVVKNCKDAKRALCVMEVGSDGVLFASEDINEIIEMDMLMEKDEFGKLQLVIGKVIDVQHIGMGYRACIDTTNLLKENEGMIIGSTSNGGLLVSSETHYLPYMELRPFRVNAGAVHSYVWSTSEMTSYITELKGGSKVLCVDKDGNTREVSVGRVKTEKRPLIKIEVEAEGKKVNAIIQDDWNIRMFGADGEVRNASTIKIGEELLVYICESGRHVGIKINETIDEK